MSLISVRRRQPDIDVLPRKPRLPVFWPKNHSQDLRAQPLQPLDSCLDPRFFRLHDVYRGSLHLLDGDAFAIEFEGLAGPKPLHRLEERCIR